MSLTPGGGGGLPWVAFLPAAGWRLLSTGLCAGHRGRCWRWTCTWRLTVLGAGVCVGGSGNREGTLVNSISRRSRMVSHKWGHSFQALKSKWEPSFERLKFSCWPGSGYSGRFTKPWTKLLNNSVAWNGSSPWTVTFATRLVTWPLLPLPGSPGPCLSGIMGLGGKQAAGQSGGSHLLHRNQGPAMGAVCPSPSQPVNRVYPPPSQLTGPGW